MQHSIQIDAVPHQNSGHIALRHKPRLLVFVITLMIVIVDHLVDHVAEGGVTDIVQQGCDLFFQVRTQ